MYLTFLIPYFDSILNRLSQDVPVAERISNTLNFLIILMPFSCDENDISVFCHIDRFPDRLSPVRFYQVILSCYPSFDVPDDINGSSDRGLSDVITAKIAVSCCHLSMVGLFPLSLSRTAENRDNAGRRAGNCGA